jgi:predicted class III extradiol MEMO1 family dioxygenase
MCARIIIAEYNAGGRRFRYTPQPTKSDGAINEIFEFIEYLDRKGMYLIEMQRPGAFSDYLREYSNTICGRHPISVWLHSVQESVLAHEVRFVKYAQSEKARSTRDHSVSYAGAVSRVAMDA